MLPTTSEASASDSPMVGPGALPQSTANPEPLLQRVNNNDVVQVLNPLSEDFGALVAMEQGSRDPFQVRQTPGLSSSIRSEADVQRTYGINLTNTDHRPVNRLGTLVRLPAGKVTNLQGGTARVAVNQLVTEMMQRAGETLKMADPHARLTYENKVVKGIKSIADIMAGQELLSPQAQVQTQLDQLNQGANHEQAFPSETVTSQPGTPAADPGTTPAPATNVSSPHRGRRK